MALKRRTLILIGLGVAAIVATIAAWLARPPPEVETVEVSPKPIERVLSVVGRVRSKNLVSVMSINPGQVIRLLHDDGDVVAVGEPLAVVRSIVEQSQAAADRARARSALAAADESRRTFDRFGPMRGTGMVSEMAVDQALRNMQTTRADAAAAVATAKASAQRAQEFTVRAPMAGKVLSRAIDNGQVVSTSMTLFELGSPHAVEIRADVDEAYADSLRSGMAARVAQTGSGVQFAAQVTEVSPKVDASTGGRLVKLTPEPGVTVAPGRSVDVTIVVDRRSNVIVVPRQAILDAANSPKVYLVDAGGVVRVRAVTIANWPSLDAIIETGLRPGDRVVMAPARTHPSARVRPVASPPPAGS